MRGSLVSQAALASQTGALPSVPSLWRSSPCSRGLILALFKALLYHGKRTQALAPAGANCFALSAPNCRAQPPPPPGSGAAPCPSAQAGVP